ncbi:MAG: AraC family transcriptional regulator [Acetatifactor sp.]
MEQQFLMLKEQTAHGNAMFPLTIYDMISDASLTERIHCHWHEEIEILAVTGGSAVLHLSNESCPITKGNILFIPSNQLHLVTCPVGEPFSFFALVFHPNLLAGPIHDAIQQQYILPVLEQDTVFPALTDTDRGWQAQARHLLDEIHSLFLHRNFGYELLIKARLLELWHLYSTHAQKREKAVKAHSDYRIDLIKKIIEHIREHYDGSISLRDLAAQFHMSEGHLCRFFKSMTRMSPVEYINFYRVSMSMELLRQTDLEISDIAMRTGFNNISYYNRLFRRYMHMTPTQYREFDG